jgi:hypothetical protein
MKKKKFKLFVMMLSTVMILILSPNETKAYFNRGNVKVSLGQSSLLLEEGQSGTVSVSITPSSDSQLPGCGMAECPQICGEKDCLDKNGDCTCAGTTYKTYYASASVSSSNTGVATATYSGGTVSIKANQEGTATISVTASLRQYNSTSTSMTVTVRGKSQKETATTAVKKEKKKTETTTAQKSKVKKVETENTTENTTETETTQKVTTEIASTENTITTEIESTEIESTEPAVTTEISNDTRSSKKHNIIKGVFSAVIATIIIVLLYLFTKKRKTGE